MYIDFWKRKEIDKYLTALDEKATIKKFKANVTYKKNKLYYLKRKN